LYHLKHQQSPFLDQALSAAHEFIVLIDGIPLNLNAGTRKQAHNEKGPRHVIITRNQNYISKIMRINQLIGI
jgi:hypothetical protein